MHFVPWHGWVVIGVVVGLVTHQFVKSRGPSIGLSLGAGIFGALLAGFLGLTTITSQGTEYYFLPSFACAAVGALLLVFLVAVVQKPK